MYSLLRDMNRRPTCFGHYTAAALWTDEHTSSKMLAFHLDGTRDVSSRNPAFIERSVAWMRSRFQLTTGRAVADFGCGPGLYATRLAASGASVTGIDFSRRSIEYARDTAARQALAIDYVHADYLAYESDQRFDLVLMVMGDYCALSPPQRQAMLDKFRACLRPGGALVFDVYSLHAFAARREAASYAFCPGDGFWSAEPYFEFQNTFKYEQERVLLDQYTIVEPARTRVVFNWYQHFDRETLRAEIEGRGLRVDEVLGSVAGDPFDPAAAEFAVVVSKPVRG